MRCLTILQVAYALAPIGPDVAGGAEQVLAALDRGLAAAGHRSIVVACEGSATAGTLVATPRRRGPFDEAVRERAALSHRRAIATALARHSVDVVHLHGVDLAGHLPPPGVPVLATLHLPPSWYPPEVFRLDRPRTSLACVSAAQRRTCPAGALNLIEDVPNGVDLELFRPRRGGRRGFALALGRICPEKGLHLALDAARLAGVPLVVGGELFPYPEHERYVAEELAPRLGPPHRFLGPVGLDRKRRLLAAARAVVVPSLAAETSSLVAMEALASGTPVVAFPSGALPEIVEHGRTGFLVTSVAEMAAALHDVERLDPRACRRAAEERFSADLMIERYLGIYRRLADGGAVPEEATTAGERAGG